MMHPIDCRRLQFRYRHPGCRYIVTNQWDAKSSQNVKIDRWKSSLSKIPYRYMETPWKITSLNRVTSTEYGRYVYSSVPYLWNFGTDPDADPEPRIRTFD